MRHLGHETKTRSGQKVSALAFPRSSSRDDDEELMLFTLTFYDPISVGPFYEVLAKKGESGDRAASLLHWIYGVMRATKEKSCAISPS